MGCSQTKQEDMKRAEQKRPDRQRIVDTEQPDAVMAYGEQRSASSHQQQKQPKQGVGQQPSPQAVSAKKNIGKQFKGMELGSEQFKDQSVTERNMVEIETFQEKVKQKEKDIVEIISSAMFDLSVNPGDIDPMQVEERERYYEEYIYKLNIKFGPMPSVLSKDHVVVPTMTPSDFQLITSSATTFSKTYGGMTVQNTEPIVLPFPALPLVKN